MIPVDSTTAFGQALRRRRRELGLTQEDLALSIGVNRRSISELERGKRTSWLSIGMDAAKALGLDIHVAERGR